MNARFIAVDVFRGLVIVLMIIVNSLDKSSSINWLKHSNWDGCTLADLVFPFFLIVVGISVVLKFSKFTPSPNSQIFKRSIFLFLIGVALNAFPHFNDFEHLRFMGVLQRIAICYLISAFLCIHTTFTFQTIFLCIILLAYWKLNLILPTTEAGHLSTNCQENYIGCIDQWLFSPSHLYQSTFDPEGMISTIPAIATTLIGNLIGYRLLSTESKPEIFFSFIAGGCVCCLLGYSWGLIYPLNKAIWSSSYVLWTGGLALCLFSVCFILVEYKAISSWFYPFQLFGQHSLFIYVIHIIGLKLQFSLYINSNNNLHTEILDKLKTMIPQNLVSISYALLYTLFCLSILIFLPKKRKTKRVVAW